MYQVKKTIKTQAYDQLTITKLVKTDHLEILAISLEKGTVFPEHTSPTDATLVLLEGDIVFHIHGEDHEVKPLEHLRFPKEEKHWVEAFENSKFLIIR
ncbi:cupin domain-containing protein [Maribacter sp. 2307ULW6-5]|uniref:cupin domain-containing protein n=1 Tax=Maribacter sp. 2307ULW6-5 TaxID=3386275 RepID=UPI0039BC8579